VDSTLRAAKRGTCEGLLVHNRWDLLAAFYWRNADQKKKLGALTGAHAYGKCTPDVYKRLVAR